MRLKGMLSRIRRLFREGESQGARRIRRNIGRYSLAMRVAKAWRVLLGYPVWAWVVVVSVRKRKGQKDQPTTGIAGVRWTKDRAMLFKKNLKDTAREFKGQAAVYVEGEWVF